MRSAVVFLLLLLFVPVHARTEEFNSTTRVWYDSRFNQGRDMNLQVQFKANVTTLEILLDHNGESESIFYGTYQNTKTNTIIEYTVNRELISDAGEYQLRLVTEVYNSSIIDQLFIKFTVLKVLQGPEILVAVILIGLSVMIPFLYDRDKRRLDMREWDRLSFKQYIMHYLEKKMFWVVLLITVIQIIGGLYFVR